MKVTIMSSRADVAGRLGPVCIACGNTKKFWVHAAGLDQLFEISELPDGDILVRACGRCRSRNSIVIAHVD